MNRSGVDGLEPGTAAIRMHGAENSAAGLIEAATVLLGTDPDRILLAVGLHLRSLDLGDLALDVERVNHGRPDPATRADLRRRGARWWLGQQAALTPVATRADRSSMSDPRAALPLLIAEIHEHSTGRLGDSTAALLAVCLTVRHGLTARARAALTD